MSGLPGLLCVTLLPLYVKAYIFDELLHRISYCPWHHKNIYQLPKSVHTALENHIWWNHCFVDAIEFSGVLIGTQMMAKGT